MPEDRSPEDRFDHEPAAPAGPGGVTFSPGASIAAIVGIVVAAVMLAIVLDGGDGEDPVVAPPPSASESSAITPAPVTDRPAVSPLSCFDLWGEEEMVLGLGSDERSPEDLGASGTGQGESCTRTLVADSAYFISLEPGSPVDFAEGTVLNATTGEPVEGVGEQARVFDDAATGVALLAVFQKATVGELFFRVSIGRPDLGPAERRKVIVDVANSMIANFPYVEIDPPEPVMIEFDREPPSPPTPALDDLITAGVEAGDWDEGVGIVAALRLLAGEESELEPPADVDIFSGSTTGVTLMALDYLENGADAAARTDIERLLGAISIDSLDSPEPGGTGEETAAPEADGGFVLVSYQEDPPDEKEVEPPTEVDAEELDDVCLVSPGFRDSICQAIDDIGPVAFAYPVDALEGEVEGWDLGDIEVIRAAIQRTIDVYLPLGSLERTWVLLSDVPTGHSGSVPQAIDGRCLTFLHKGLQDISAQEQSFVVAMELAGCFLWRNLPREVFGSYSAAKWWFQGMVVYLAAEVYPLANIEWRSPVSSLEGSELSTSLQNRHASANWVFFRSVAVNGGGPQAGLDLVRGLSNALTQKAQQDKLASNTASEPALHVFHQELSDGEITDSGRVERKYVPSSFEVEISGPSIVIDEPIRFGVSRIHVSVVPGMYACLEYEISDNVIASWRSGPPGVSGPWTFDIPTEISGESVFVATTVEEGQSFAFSAEVGDEPGCDEDGSGGGDADIPDCGLCDPSWYFWFERTFASLFD